MGKVHTILIPDFFSDEWMEVEVERPDFALIANSIYDYSGLVKVVHEVFDVGTDSNATTKVKSHKADEKEITLLLNDLCSRALVSPTYDFFEKNMPLDDTQKAIICQWVMDEARNLHPIIRDKDIAMPIVVQARKFHMSPSSVIDPRNTFSGITHISFNRAITEYLLFLEDEQVPADYRKNNGTGVSNSEALGDLGIKMVKKQKNVEDGTHPKTDTLALLHEISKQNQT
jgi:hypothetical protein